MWAIGKRTNDAVAWPESRATVFVEIFGESGLTKQDPSFMMYMHRKGVLLVSKRIDNTACHCLKMRRSAENVIRFYDQLLAPSGVTVRQYSLLYAIAQHSGCNVRELSEATLLDRSTLARSLKPLMKAGYLKDSKVTGARDCVLKLTKQGQAVCDQAAGLWEVAQRKFEEKLSAAQLAALEDALTALQDL